jgi:hypothetical protein
MLQCIILKQRSNHMTTATDTSNKDDAKRFAELIGPTDPKLDHGQSWHATKG